MGEKGPGMPGFHPSLAQVKTRQGKFEVSKIAASITHACTYTQHTHTRCFAVSFLGGCMTRSHIA